MGAKRRFLDKLRIYIKAGSGGYGLSKYGGIGGSGGHVYLQGCKDSTLKSLLSRNENKRFIAGNGKDSNRLKLQGEPGDNCLIKCPLGVSVYTDKRICLGEIKNEGDMLLVAKGGLGGDEKSSYLGNKGHQLSIILDHKLIADVGFVGFPNAGKSTLLKSLSHAKPKIASYPFTTIEPKIGIMEYPDTRQISLADLPGLIEGAHINAGMGHNFLKHLEHTKMLLMLVDVMGFRLKPQSPLRTAFENVLLLNKELELYKKELLEKPCLLVINKTDIIGSAGRLNHLMKDLEELPERKEKLDPELRPETLIKFTDVVHISASKKTNLDLLKNRIRTLLDEEDDEEDATNREDILKDSMTEHIPLKAI